MRRWISALGAAWSLSGCSLLSPVPLWELAKGGGAVVAKALELSPGDPADTVVHRPWRERALCIELNPACPVGDIVPALQAALAAQGVSSRVYDTGAAGADCSAWMSYEAALAWDVPAMSAAPQAFMSQATLGLRDGAGRVLGASRYDADQQPLSRGKWASTQAKLAPVVAALLSPRS